MFDVYQENYLEEINVQSYWYEDLHENSRFSQELSLQVDLQKNQQSHSKIKSSDLENSCLPLTHIFKIG